MGEITSRVFLAVFFWSIITLLPTSAMALNYEGPSPIPGSKGTAKGYFVGFVLYNAPTISLKENNPASCENASDGSLLIEISGGTTPYTISWSDGSSGNSESLNNLSPGQYSVTVTDGEGEQASDTFTVTFQDDVKPVVATRNLTVQLNNNGTASIQASDINNGSSDNCGIDTISVSPNNFDCTNVGANTVTLSVTDINGNTNSAIATVTVEDNVKPQVITQDITVQLDANGQASITPEDINNGSNDTCGIQNLSLNVNSFNCSNIGNNTVTLTITDNNGNSAYKDATVTVQDNIDPEVITQNIRVQLDANGHASITTEDIDNGSNDACGIQNLSLDTSTFNCSNIGDNIVTLTATDENGNSASETATVIVEDNIDPVTPNIPALEWTCEDEIKDFPTTNDNCSGEITATTNDDLVFEGFGTYSITWTFTDDSGNFVTATQEIIIPEPTVEIPNINNSAFCNTETVPDINFSGENTTSFQWSYEKNSNTDIGLASSGTGNIPAFTAKNNSSEPVVVNFTVIPFGGNCQGEPKNFQITINPTPSITIPNDIEICEGETISTIDLSNFSVDGSIVEWTNDNTQIGLNANGTGNIASFIAANGTNQAQIATISLIPSANNCVGETQTFTIEVKPKPQFEIPEIPEFCNGAPTQAIPLSPNFSGITYDITGGSSIGLSNKSGVTEIPSFTPVNNSDAPVNATIKITPKANGCIGETVEVPITVKPSPVVVASFSNQICSEETTNISLSSSVNNTGFTWTVVAPAGIEGAASGSLATEGTIEQELINTTSQAQTVIYRITPDANNCSGATIPISITVNPTPDFDITIPECVTSVDLTNSSIKNNNNLTYTYWEDEDATLEVSNPKEVGLGTYFIKGESAQGCSNTKEVIITQITPKLTSSAIVDEVCSGASFYYEFESNIPAKNYYWVRREREGINGTESGEGNIEDILTNNSQSTITVEYEIIIESENGCVVGEENPIIIEVPVSPSPKLTGDKTFEVCSGQEFDTNNGLDISNSTFSWEMVPRNGISATKTSGTGAINTTLTNSTDTRINRVEFVYSFAYGSCNPKTESVFVDVKPAPIVEAGVSMANQSKNDAVQEIEICSPSSPAEINDIKLYSSSTLNQESAEPLNLNYNFENGNQGWSSSGSPNWSRANDGRLAYENCYWWIFCSDVNFDSPNGNRYFLLNGQNNVNNSRLISPPINTVGQSNIRLTFDHYFRNSSGRGFIEYSINGGNNWQRIEQNQSYNNPQGSPNNFASSGEFTLPSGHENLILRFRYNGGGNERDYWAIDNINITSESATSSSVYWTRSDDANWRVENKPNLLPEDIGQVTETTVFTATYTYDIENEDICNQGSKSVKVIVKDPLQPRIVADYCAFEESNKIRLSADQEYDTYRWESPGEIISNGASIDINLAQTYTLFVTKDGCEASTSITPSENLVTNGDFEDGNTGFSTVYRYVAPGGNLYPEGDYAVDNNARDYHNDFYGFGHGGSGNFMIVNGDPSQGNVVWQTDPITITPDTDYYFSAWTSNLVAREEARLRLVITLPGQNTPLAESNLGDLTGLPSGEWIQFYNPQVWNSGSNTEVVLKIINENPVRDGNDFGIDDISFSAFRSFDFEFTPENNGPVCENETIELTANLDGGRLPITFDWTGPNGFSHSTTITEQEDLAAADTLSIPNATPEMAGEYSLQITDFYGCNLESKTTTVEIIQKAVVHAGENMVICSNEPVIDLSEASITHPTIKTGFWTTINGDNSRFTNPNSINTTYNPNEDEINSGEIELILTSDQDTGAICESVSDTINIIFNLSPVLELVPQDVACFEGNNGQIEVIIAENTGTSPFSYQWSNGQTGRVADNLIAGDYYVDVTDASSCTVRSDTITIKQPEKLLVGNPIELEEASCFGDFGAVVTIPVSGGLFAEETVDADNIPYQLDILNSEGNSVSLSEDQITYNITDEQFIISGLQGGKAYTFLVSSSENCSAEVKTFTTLTPPEINAGETPEISECGVRTIWLAASPVDPEIGTGSWSYNNGETELLGDPTNPNTSLTGQAGKAYTLTWRVTSASNPTCIVSRDIEVFFPPSCSQLNFDGIDDFVDLGNHYNFSAGFSIEAWIKPHSTSGTKTIFSKRSSENQNAGYDLSLNNGAPTFRVLDKSVVSGSKVNTNRWFHIAAVYNPGSQLKIYVDGIEIQTNASNIPNSVAATETPALIGATYAPNEIIESKDHFEGYIEEVRIWEGAISATQIRFFMNQRLEKEGDNVSGAVLGNNLNLPNAPEAITWTKLNGYYQLLAQNNLIGDGFTGNLGNIGATANGLLKNIQDMQENTAPMPYESNNGGAWHNRSSWDSNSTKFWTFPNDKGINGEEINWNIAVQKHNLNSNNKDIKLLGLFNESGQDLEMQGTNNESGNELRITHYLKLDGFIDLNGESQLVQTSGSILDETSSGYIERDQQGTQNSFNYNYWSAPVSRQNTANNSGYTIASILKDGTNTNSPQDLSFAYAHTHADASYSGNKRISTYWLHKFHGDANSYGHWRWIGHTGELKAGEGFTMKGTSGQAAISDQQNYIFQGKPNNGTIALNISNNENRLVGNPYPSALDADEFLRDNLKDINGGRNSQNVFNGALYFWDHFGQENSHVLREYVGGYATYNLSGGAPAASTDFRINNSTDKEGSKVPQRYVPVGQGFFVNTVLDDAVSGNYSISGGNVLFKNNQRIFKKETISESRFLRPEEHSKEKQAEYKQDTRYKLRLKFKSPAGYHRQLLATADANTTNDFDLGYDAPMIDNNLEDMYWLIKDVEFVIQGVPNFNPDQVLPLGLKTAKPGRMEISIDSLENFPDNLPVFLKNKYDSTYHDLRKEAYTSQITSEGENNDQYEIVFSQPQTENVEGDFSEINLSIRYYHQEQQIHLLNPDLLDIQQLKIYSITGQEVASFGNQPIQKDIRLRLKNPLSNAVYIVKVMTAQESYSGKFLFKKRD
ncbi:PKD-like domain-containing protein [Salegentibacter sp. HM20]